MAITLATPIPFKPTTPAPTIVELAQQYADLMREQLVLEARYPDDTPGASEAFDDLESRIQNTVFSIADAVARHHCPITMLRIDMDAGVAADKRYAEQLAHAAQMRADSQAWRAERLGIDALV